MSHPGQKAPRGQVSVPRTRHSSEVRCDVRSQERDLFRTQTVTRDPTSPSVLEVFIHFRTPDADWTLHNSSMLAKKKMSSGTGALWLAFLPASLLA